MELDFYFPIYVHGVNREKFNFLLRRLSSPPPCFPLSIPFSRILIHYLSVTYNSTACVTCWSHALLISAVLINVALTNVTVVDFAFCTYKFNWNPLPRKLRTCDV